MNTLKGVFNFVLSITLIFLVDFHGSCSCVAQKLYDQVDGDVSHQILHLNASRLCSDLCSVLLNGYGPDHVLTPNANTYTEFQGAYWSSLQSEVQPQCVFLPPDETALASFVSLAAQMRCPFAIRSGGHSAFAGAASIQGGTTVSLHYLDGISLSTDKKLVSLGPGSTWGDIYEELAKHELSVVGGRIAPVGIGGFTLGGGISFYSGTHGWGCDNVEAYEVVTAAGILVTASPTENQDLYWALRGGGNNFGIVTKFHVRAVSTPKNTIWFSTRTYVEAELTHMIQAFTNTALNAESDPQVGWWCSFYQFDGENRATSLLWYTNAQNINETRIFDDINQVKHAYAQTGPQTLMDFMEQTRSSSPYGKREVYWTMTVKSSAGLASFAVKHFFASLTTVSRISNFFPVLHYEYITVPQMRAMGQNGGNPLGLDPDDGPLLLIAIMASWSKAEDDEVVYGFVSDVLRTISDEAKKLGVQHDYIYMNYASQFQNVVRGYGSKNQAKLVEIAKKYDPYGVFQILQPGHFKLEGSPVESKYLLGW